jgi:DNA-binding response OmpR family regulator
MLAYMDVLVVEDEVRLADIMARNLRARGHAARVAATAQEAIAEIERSLPNVLLLDVNLPDMTGWDILRQLDAARRQQIKVIVVSAGPISQKRIEEFRPERHLEKPFPIDALVRMLAELEPGPRSEGTGGS